VPSLETNWIYAEKTEGGYWHDAMVHEGKKSDSGIQIKLSHENPVAHVVVRLGVSPAHLTFNISDKNTGKAAVTSAVGRQVVVDDIFYASDPNQPERGICFT
jgi:hypothetical protein